MSGGSRTYLGGPAAAASKFGADAAKLALARGNQRLRGEADLDFEGMAVPSGVPGLRWWGDGRFSVDPSGVSPPVNGTSITNYVDHHVAADTLSNSGAARPTYQGTGLGGKPALVFATGSSQYLAGTDPSPPFVQFGRLMVMACKINAAPSDDATPYMNAALWADHSFGYQGLYVRSSQKVQAYWYDAVGAAGWTNFCAEATATFGQVLVIVAHLRGDLTQAPWGFMELQVNNDTKVVSASAIRTRNSIQNPMRLARGNNGVATLDCVISDQLAAFDGNVEQPYEVEVVARVRERFRRRFGAW